MSHLQHTDPDYSCVYVTIKTNASIEGYGLTFTCGRGNEIVQMGVKALSTLVVGRQLRNDIYSRFAMFWRELTSETQMRWVSMFTQMIFKFRKLRLRQRYFDICQLNSRHNDENFLWKK